MQKIATKPNCKIDEPFYQGQIGDCWFLATIAAIQRSPKGQEILNNMITDNKDGMYTVKFKGADEPITVLISELQERNDWSSGDLDARILEVAADKYYNIRGISYGGNPTSAMELFLATGECWKNLGRAFISKPDYQEIAKEIPEDAPYKDDVAIAHAYAVNRIDGDNIYLINPWHTDSEIPIPLNVFDEYWAFVQYTEIT